MAGGPDGPRRRRPVRRRREHAVLHLLYARFWHKVLFDLGHVSTPEPFHRLYNQGNILAAVYTSPAGRYVPAAEVVETEEGLFYEGEPVSRQTARWARASERGHPRRDLRAYGADTLRLYEMSMGPLDRTGPGARRHRRRPPVPAAAVAQRRRRGNRRARPAADPMPATDPLCTLANRTIDDVTRRFAELRLNVATARLTDLNNALTGFVLRERRCPRPIAESLILMTYRLHRMSPRSCGRPWVSSTRIDDTPFPVADPAALDEAFVVIPVTVDGKARGTITIAREAAEAEADAVAAGLRLDTVAALMADREIARVVFVPGKDPQPRDQTRIPIG